jgi:hypothetical protein
MMYWSRLFVAAAAATALAATAACNSLGDCPAAAEVVPGGTCSGDQLQCAYTLSTQTAACDGVMTTVATSCTCSGGSWVCPTGFCDATTTDAGASEGGATDGVAPSDGASDAGPG